MSPHVKVNPNQLFDFKTDTMKSNKTSPFRTKTPKIMSNTDTQKKMVTERPPVVVVMGHIDHGKIYPPRLYSCKTNIVDKSWRHYSACLSI